MQQRNSRRDRDDFSFEIIKHYGVLSTSPKGWSRELNYVRWNGREPKFDIRDWQSDHEKMSKGITLTSAEMSELMKILRNIETGQAEEKLSEAQCEPEGIMPETESEKTGLQSAADIRVSPDGGFTECAAT